MATQLLEQHDLASNRLDDLLYTAQLSLTLTSGNVLRATFEVSANQSAGSSQWTSKPIEITHSGSDTSRRSNIRKITSR